MLSQRPTAAPRLVARGPAALLPGRPWMCMQAARKDVESASQQHPQPVAPSAASKLQSVMAAAAVALAVCAGSPAGALAVDSAPEAVYFGNGCFWGRQFDMVNTEKALGRAPEEMSAVVGYAGGRAAGPDGKVCYYVADPRTVYERLGHAEVVQVALTPGDAAKQTAEFRRFADTYFKQFRRTETGMQRLDPQDQGPGYRNVIGLPGGVNSPLFKVLQEANVHGMELRAGNGNQWENGGRVATEDDLLNVVWVVDSQELPFYRAEQYHQFHNGIGKFFPLSYTWDLKNRFAQQGKIGSTGCPELPF